MLFVFLLFAQYNELSSLVINDKLSENRSSSLSMKDLKLVSDKKVEIYVINLDHRKDRCECSKLQFEESPYPVYRFSAATSTNHLELCPSLKFSHKVPESLNLDVRKRANYCSHHLVWKAVSEREDKPDFVIIVEDDVVVPPIFWKQLHQLLHSDCLNTELIAVDTYGRGLRNKKSTCATETGVQELWGSTTDRYGSHFLITPTAILDQLILQNWHGTDHWKNYQNVTVKIWQPTMLRRGSSFRRGQGNVPNDCSPSVKQSDIGRSARLRSKSATSFQC